MTKKQVSPHEKFLRDMDKAYGDIIQDVTPIKYLDTGIRQWNRLAVGGPGGGLPCSVPIMLYGPPGAAKSTILLQTARYVQACGKAVMWIDAEQAFDMQYAEAIGVNVHDPNLFIYAVSNIAEETFEMMEQWINHVHENDFPLGLIVIDSISALQTQVAFTSAYDKSNMAQEARFFSQKFNRFLNALRCVDVAMVSINQIRTDINVNQKYGNPEKASGGNALQHRMRLVHYAQGQRATSKQKDGPAPWIDVEFNTKATGCKNQVGGGLKNDEIHMLVNVDVYSENIGVDDLTDMVRYAASIGIFTNGRKEIPNGTNLWFYHKGRSDEIRLGKGEAEVIAALLDNPSLYTQISDEIDRIDNAIRDLRNRGTQAKEIRRAWQQMIGEDDALANEGKNAPGLPAQKGAGSNIESAVPESL